MFGIHRSSYHYWLGRPRQPDAKRIVLQGRVCEVHRVSNGSAGARSIAEMVSAKGVQLSRWRASKIMKELNIVSC
ncbi:Transposase [Yersinia ruckeri]|nr:transposase insO for insertion sequence element IS911A [Yersinia ruckeri ATCC 29473]QTD77922.1 Transposase [Yersinia ruckeri]